VSDHFERVKTEILQRTTGNGGPTPLDLLNAIEATNTDQDERAETLREETLANRTHNEDAHKEIIDKLDEHITLLHSVDDESDDMKRAWRKLRWAIIAFLGAAIIILADQLGNLIFGGAT